MTEAYDAAFQLTDEDEDEHDFEPYHREWMAKQEREWRDAGLTVAWIDTRPKWESICVWSSEPKFASIMRLPLIDPVAPCRRRWRFSLIGGGQIKIIEHWVENEPHPLITNPVWNQQTSITVIAHVDDQLRYYHGKIDHIVGEMYAAAIVLYGTGGDKQAVADRAAATLQALTEKEDADCSPPDRDRFYALLDGARGCCVCGRRLRDEVSKLLAIGPDCARKWSVPHSRTVAAKRLQLRKLILGGERHE